jgi:ABC-2 type transport system permease protein
MRKTLVIALREYNSAVRTKAFLISLVLMPVMMGGSLLVQVLLKETDVKDKKLAVIDRSPGGTLAPAIRAAFDAYNQTAVYDPETKKQVRPRYLVEQEGDRSALEAQMRKGELAGFLVIGPGVFEQPGPPGKEDPERSVVYETNRLAGMEVRGLIEKVVNEAVQAVRGKKAALPDEKRRAITQPVPLEMKVQAVFAAPMVLMLLMFLVLMMVANPLMQGVVEEKMNRIAEVLLGSVTPFQLMLGKLLGITAVALTIVTVYLGGAVWAARYYGFADYIPPAGLFVWFFVFQIAAALMYGALFAAIGAACTDMKETQNLLLPVMLICCVPMFLLTHVIREPNGPVVTAVSFFPFATPMLMIARQAIPPGVPAWQPYAGAAVVLATTLFCVWAAGRIFRVGLLMQGKGANLAQMARWVLRG